MFKNIVNQKASLVGLNLLTLGALGLPALAQAQGEVSKGTSEHVAISTARIDPIYSEVIYAPGVNRGIKVDLFLKVRLNEKGEPQFSGVFHSPLRICWLESSSCADGNEVIKINRIDSTPGLRSYLLQRVRNDLGLTNIMEVLAPEHTASKVDLVSIGAEYKPNTVVSQVEGQFLKGTAYDEYFWILPADQGLAAAIKDKPGSIKLNGNDALSVVNFSSAHIDLEAACTLTSKRLQEIKQSKGGANLSKEEVHTEILNQFKIAATIRIIDSRHEHTILQWLAGPVQIAVNHFMANNQRIDPEVLTRQLSSADQGHVVVADLSKKGVDSVTDGVTEGKGSSKSSGRMSESISGSRSGAQQQRAIQVDRTFVDLGGPLGLIFGGTPSLSNEVHSSTNSRWNERVNEFKNLSQEQQGEYASSTVANERSRTENMLREVSFESQGSGSLSFKSEGKLSVIVASDEPTAVPSYGQVILVNSLDEAEKLVDGHIKLQQKLVEELRAEFIRKLADLKLIDEIRRGVFSARRYLVATYSDVLPTLTEPVVPEPLVAFVQGAKNADKDELKKLKTALVTNLAPELATIYDIDPTSQERCQLKVLIKVLDELGLQIISSAKQELESLTMAIDEAEFHRGSITTDTRRSRDHRAFWGALLKSGLGSNDWR